MRAVLRPFALAALATLALPTAAQAAPAEPSPSPLANGAALAQAVHAASPARTAGASTVTPPWPSGCLAFALEARGSDLLVSAWTAGDVTPLTLATGVPFAPQAMTVTQSTRLSVLAVEPGTGALYRWTTTSTASGPLVSTKIAASGWSGIRALTSTGRHVYATTAAGQLVRYAMRADGTLRSAGTVRASGWGAVRSLSGLTSSMRGDAVDRFTAVTGSGYLVDYRVSLTDPTKVSSSVVSTSSWRGFKHVVSGLCTKDSATATTVTESRPILGINPTGDVLLYRDYSPTTTTVRSLGKVATGWTGVFTS